MIEIIADMHTHTVHSHGTGTVEDNVKAAISAGLQQIVISDHGPLHSYYNIKDVDAYLRDIDAMRKKYKSDIDVLAGVELNLLSAQGDIDLPPDYADSFDVKLMGYHKLVHYKTVADRLHMLLFKTKSERALERNTQAYLNAMDKTNIDIIVHIGYGLPVDILKVARHAAEKNVVLEINAKHPVLEALNNTYKEDKEAVKEYAQLLYSQALLIEGLPVEDPVAFSNAVCKLMTK